MSSRPPNAPPDPKRLNAAEYPVLAVLNMAPAHGYDVWRYLDENLGGIWNLGRSQVYALLSQMERDGLLRHERVEQSTFPTRKVFHLTDEGRRVLEGWISSPVHHLRDFRLEFPAKLHFARTHIPELASKLIRQQVRTCRNQKDRLEAARARCKTEIERNVLAYRINIVDATVRWLEGLADETRIR
ncbi:MAG: PadR family transcriptional regulator [Desulfomonilaceae bacterium]|nr:PadR family transcriptional regulator [Desulfomonilaceae bacterium]